MENVEKFKLDYQKVSNNYFDDKTVEYFKEFFKRYKKICVKPEISHDPNVIRDWCYAPVHSFIFVFVRITKKIKNKKHITWEYLGYYH